MQSDRPINRRAQRQGALEGQQQGDWDGEQESARHVERTAPPRAWKAWLLAALLLAPGLAWAGSTADDLAQIEAEHVLAKARLRLVETQAQIAARRADIERQAPQARNGLPTVVGIEGMASHLWATLQLDSGLVAEVKEGDILPNGMRVASIAPGGVVVRTAANKRVRLKPAGEAPIDASAYVQRAGPLGGYPAAPSGVMSMPPLSPPQAAAPSTAQRPQLTPGAVR